MKVITARFAAVASLAAVAIPAAVAILATVAILAALPLVAVAAAPSELAQTVRVYLDRQALPGGGEVEIVVGEPDPRLQLAECARYEPFVPPGARLWGRATLGVRCVEGAAWTVYIPVHVHVYAQALVAARPLPRGVTLTADDVRAERVDLTQFSAGVHGAEDSIEGKTTVRSLAVGEALRRDALRAPLVLRAGDPVKVVLDGAGFALEIDGKALSAAGEGEPTRVSLVTGRILTGVARPGRIVQVR